MSESHYEDPLKDFEQFLLTRYSQGAFEEITNWIEREMIVCSTKPIPSLRLFSDGVRNVLLAFMQAKDFEAFETLWQAIVGKEFREEHGACPVRTSLFRSSVCHIIARVIIATAAKDDTYTRFVDGVREQLGTFLRAAILEHQYVDDGPSINVIRNLCETALLLVDYEDSDQELLKIFDVRGESSHHNCAKSEEPPKHGGGTSREAEEEASAPTDYCAKHKREQLLLELVMKEPGPSDAGQARQQHSSSDPESSAQDQLSPLVAVDSPAESSEAESRSGELGGGLIVGEYQQLDSESSD